MLIQLYRGRGSDSNKINLLIRPANLLARLVNLLIWLVSVLIRPVTYVNSSYQFINSACELFRTKCTVVQAAELILVKIWTLQTSTKILKLFWTRCSRGSKSLTNLSRQVPTLFTNVKKLIPVLVNLFFAQSWSQKYLCIPETVFRFETNFKYFEIFRWYSAFILNV